MRATDIERIKNPKKRERLEMVSEEYNKRVREYTKRLYNNGEFLFSYPEGEVMHEDMGKIKTGVIRKTLEIQKEIDKEIPIIPMGTEYNGFIKVPSMPKPPAVVRIGEPKIIEPDILEDKSRFEEFGRELGEEIAYLSGLS